MKTITEISITYNPKLKLSTLPKVTTSKEAEKQFRGFWSNRMNHIEEMYLILLNRDNKALGITKISRGGTSGTLVDRKVIFQVALKANAHSIILCHNHPSGNIQPSEADIKLTKAVKEASILMDIPLIDHLIITQENYYSFGDEGMI